jgi:hypothetical protein
MVKVPLAGLEPNVHGYRADFSRFQGAWVAADIQYRTRPGFDSCRRLRFEERDGIVPHWPVHVQEALQTYSMGT